MKWISVKSEMPDGDRNVLATYKNGHGKSRIIKAFYAGKYQVECGSPDYYDDVINDEYCEDNDTYYLKEGWYEVIENWPEYGSIVVSEGEITHWMPLPPPPDKEDV